MGLGSVRACGVATRLDRAGRSFGIWSVQPPDSLVAESVDLDFAILVLDGVLGGMGVELLDAAEVPLGHGWPEDLDFAAEEAVVELDAFHRGVGGCSRGWTAFPLEWLGTQLDPLLRTVLPVVSHQVL